MTEMSSERRCGSHVRTCCMACVSGLMGCRWRRYQRSTLPSNKCDVFWFWFLNCSSVYMIFWFYYWLLAGNSMDSINWRAYEMFGSFVPLYAILFILTCIALGYIVLMFLLAVLHIAFNHQVYIHWSHRIALCTILLFCVAVTIAMDIVWSEGWTLQNVSLMVTAPFLFLSSVILLTLLSWFILSWIIPSRGQQISLHYKSGMSAAVRVVMFLLYAAVMCLLYVSPLFINSPCITDNLPAKPRLVAHKGASAIAPENTVAAFRYATNYSVLVLESDVSISYDGVPFILHDTTFKRTSNIAQVFPGRENVPACWFNISDILKLDAGSWFLKDNPYGTVSGLTEFDKKLFRNQTVTTLAQLLEIARDSNTSVMFDIKFMDDINSGECAGHPYQNNFTDVIMDTVDQVKLPNDKMWWLYYNRLNFTTDDGTKSNQFNYTSVSADRSIPPAQLNQSGVHIVNFAYHAVDETSVRQYNENEVSVNLWTVDSAWLFSVGWCMGASSITSNICHRLHHLSSPVWHMTESEYQLFWILTDVVSCSIILFIIVMRIVIRVRSPLSSAEDSCTGVTYRAGETMSSKLLRDAHQDLSSCDEESSSPTQTDIQLHHL